MLSVKREKKRDLKKNRHRVWFPLNETAIHIFENCNRFAKFINIKRLQYMGKYILKQMKYLVA